MFFQRIKTPGIAHNAYLIGTEGIGILVDPRRDIDEYLTIARKNDGAEDHGDRHCSRHNWCSHAGARGTGLATYPGGRLGEGDHRWNYFWDWACHLWVMPRHECSRMRQRETRRHSGCNRNVPGGGHICRRIFCIGPIHEINARLWKSDAAPIHGYDAVALGDWGHSDYDDCIDYPGTHSMAEGTAGPENVEIVDYH